MTSRCEKCGHVYNDHGRHGGSCSHDTFTEERIESDDTVEIRRGFDRCDCTYFRGAYIPAAAGMGKP